MSRRDQASKTKKKAVSKSRQAGLVFPVGRVAQHLKGWGYPSGYSQQVGATAPVYLAAVLEYLAAEVLESAGDVCQRSKDTRVTPRHIELATRGDQELGQVFAGVTIPSGGVVPVVHPFVLAKKTARKAEAASSSEFDRS